MSQLDGLIRAHIRTNTITIMAGNFLAPSLLSSLDMGKGMVDAMNRVGPHGIQLACLGNREAYIPLDELSLRAQEFRGTLISSNLPALAVEPALPPHHILEISAGAHCRRIAFVGLVTLDASLYQCDHCPAFGGALPAGRDPLAAFEAARRSLLEEHACDLVVPVTHQRLCDDKALAARLAESPGGGVALIVGGHDLKPAVEAAGGGCLIAKSGANGRHAVIVDVSWQSRRTEGARPLVTAKLHAVAEHPRSARLDQAIAQHHQVLRNADAVALFEVPPAFRPLSSEGVQQRQATAGTLLATLCRAALRCDAAALDASEVLDAQRYPDGVDRLTYGDLRRLVPHDAAVCVVRLPGAVLTAAVAHSRAQAPRPWLGFLQLDDAAEYDVAAGRLTRVGGAPLEADREYRVAVLFHSLNGANRNQPLIDWANAHGAPHFSATLPLKYILVRAAREQVLGRPSESSGAAGDSEAGARDTVDREQVKDRLRRLVGDAAEVPDLMAGNLMSLVDPDNRGRLDRREFNNFVSFAEQLEAFRRNASECTLRIITVNDVYELGNLPYLDGVIRWVSGRAAHACIHVRI